MRRSEVDGWLSSEPPRGHFRRRVWRRRKGLPRQMCKICKGYGARWLEGYGFAHRSCFLVWVQADSRQRARDLFGEGAEESEALRWAARFGKLEDDDDA